MLYFDWRENSQSYFHTLQAHNVSPTCDAADVKSIIQLFPHSSQHVTGNSSHSLSDAPLQIIDIGTLRDFLSIRSQDMDLVSVVFVKLIFESVYFFLNNPVQCDSFSKLSPAGWNTPHQQLANIYCLSRDVLFFCCYYDKTVCRWLYRLFYSLSNIYLYFSDEEILMIFRMHPLHIKLSINHT
jgi:hypothetical protein